MIRYLLGELSPEEQLEVEAGYFANPESFDRLRAVEFDLIEGYVTGKLSVADRGRFEICYLTSPVRRERVEFFDTLAQSIPLRADLPSPEFLSVPVVLPESNDPDPGVSWWQALWAFFQGPRLALTLAGTAAVVFLTVSAIWQASETVRLRRQLALTEAARLNLQERAQDLNRLIEAEQARNGELAQELQNLRPKPETASAVAPRPLPAAISFAWTLSGLRDIESTGSSPRILRIPPGTELVELNFNLPGTRFAYYRLALQTLSGEELWSRNRLVANQTRSTGFLVLKVPAEQLQKGPYILALTGIDPGKDGVGIGEFYIEVDRPRR
ncbi:MAG TPA: hypothetical protein VJ302_16965 [Blastocatellia bacterium]|nr:hypothetical protein [Blastocatellia bacterium]